MYVRCDQIACSSLGNAAQFVATATLSGDREKERERGRVMYKQDIVASTRQVYLIEPQVVSCLV